MASRADEYLRRAQQCLESVALSIFGRPSFTPCPAPGKLLLSIFSQASARNRGRWRWHCPSSQSAGGDDCVAGHVGLELRNVGKNYPFERSRRFPGILANSSHRDYSRLSCGGGETQLGISAGISAGFLARALGHRGASPTLQEFLPIQR